MLFTSSPAGPNQPISLQALLNQTPGGLRRQGGRRLPVIHSSSSTITRPFSTRLYGKHLTYHAYLSNCFPDFSGQWAGAVWSSTGIPGQEQSCAQETGFPTCEAFVRANGAAMNEACACFPSPFNEIFQWNLISILDWEVQSVKIYQLQSS